MSVENQLECYQKLKSLGNESFKLKDYVKALRYYTEAIAAKDDEAVVYSNRAICYLNLKRFFEAEADCNRALELDPSLTKAYYRRAIAEKELFRYQKALSDFQKVADLDKNSTLTRREIDNILRLLKEDTRIEIETKDKPGDMRSKTSLKTIKLLNQYSGIRYY